MKDIRRVPSRVSPEDIDALRRVAGRVTLDVMAVAAFFLGLACLWLHK